MPILSHPSFGPRTALAYVTGGALLDVWTLVWYFTREVELSPSGRFWVIGLGLTGLTLVTLGLLLGRLGRAARQSELPPLEAMRAEAMIQQTAAAHPAVVAGPAQAPVVAAPVPPPAITTPEIVAPPAIPAPARY